LLLILMNARACFELTLEVSIQKNA